MQWKSLTLNSAGYRSQQGAALLAMVLVVFITASTMLFSAVRPPSGIQEDNAETYKQLANAKEALITYAANYSSLNVDGDGPGRLPCPDTTDSGVPDASCNYSYAGRLPEFLTLPSNVRFEINDYYANRDLQFWYALSPNYRHNNIGAQLNSSTAPSLTLDGQQVVAIIIAPGSAVATQARPSSDLSGGDFLEGGNEDIASSEYVSSQPDDPSNFNDMTVSITRDEIMTGTTALVAHEVKTVLDNIRTHFVYSDYATSFADIAQRVNFTVLLSSFGWGQPVADMPIWVFQDNWNTLGVATYSRLNSNTVTLRFQNCNILYTITSGQPITRNPAKC